MGRYIIRRVITAVPTLVLPDGRYSVDRPEHHEELTAVGKTYQNEESDTSRRAVLETVSVLWPSWTRTCARTCRPAVVPGCCGITDSSTQTGR